MDFWACFIWRSYQERLEREFDLSIILTAPSVKYRLETDDGEELEVDNPEFYPGEDKIEKPTSRSSEPTS